MTRPLTSRQREIVRFIVAFRETNGYSPTMREIGVRLGIRSTNGVADHLRALERKGAIRRGPPGTGRSIVPLVSMEGLA